MIVQGRHVREGDILVDFGNARVDEIRDCRDGDLKFRCNDDTATIWVGPEEPVSVKRVLKLRKE
jgi:hypothetical protein